MLTADFKFVGTRVQLDVGSFFFSFYLSSSDLLHIKTNVKNSRGCRYSSDQPFKLASKPTFDDDDPEILKDLAVEECPLYFRPILKVLRNV